MATYQEENNNFFRFLLEKRFFEPFRDSKHIFHQATQLELFITPTCNAKCEYCYLKDNENLYPKEIINKEVILDNLDKVLNWCIKEKFDFKDISLFSGEIWHTNFGRDVLFKILLAIDRGFKVSDIIIPTNGTFCYKDETRIIIENFVKDFESRGTKIHFSFSVDGKYADVGARPFNYSYTDEYYERLFSFSRFYNMCFHPMISKVSIKNQIENFKWWKEQCEKHHINFWDAIMMLEVRNDDWDDESIDEYCKWLTYVAEQFLKECGGPKDYIQFGLNNVNTKIRLTDGANYAPWIIHYGNEYLTCSSGYALCVRLGDLAICPCHRTAYEKNIYGYLRPQEDGTMEYEEHNAPLMTSVLFANATDRIIKCSSCVYKQTCLLGCLGAQEERFHDMFVPIESVCKLQQKKIQCLIDFYEKHGMIKILEDIDYKDSYYVNAQRILNLIKEIKKNEEEN